jgi:hypothetical protein
VKQTTRKASLCGVIIGETWRGEASPNFSYPRLFFGYRVEEGQIENFLNDYLCGVRIEKMKKNCVLKEAEEGLGRFCPPPSRQHY